MLNQNLLLTGDDGGYLIQRSLRFRKSASPYFSRTYATPTNAKKGTISLWYKRGALGGGGTIFTVFGQVDTSIGSGPYIQFSNDAVRFYDNNTDLYSTALFRDPAAWYHIVIAIDTTQATSTNRAKMYVNGLQITSFDTPAYGSQNYNSDILASGSQYIGYSQPSNSRGSDGYLADVHFIDGQQLTPSSFGEFDATTGVWKPKAYTGTYGTNGFKLDFSDNSAATAAAIGKDSSGNGNNWTPNNISLTSGATYDSMLDVPTLTSATTANYCVLNPLDKGSNNTLSDGNLQFQIASTQQGIVRSTISLPKTGKWYCEATKISYGNLAAGIATSSAAFTTYLGGDAYGWGYFSLDGVVYNNNASVGSGATLANGDILGIAFDSDNGTLKFYKNNSLQVTVTGLTPSTVTYFFAGGSYQGGGIFNFGQQPFAYTPPTGFKALNTYNLPDSTILAGNKHFDVSLYTGNTTGQSIVNSGGFEPGLVWLKGRSFSYVHLLIDIVRGVSKYLISNLTDAEGTAATGITSFNSNGFTLGNDGGSFNNSGQTYAAWQWKGGGSAVSNTSGSITSQVSANPSAGFSVVTYTSPSGGATTYTVGHGLGVTPDLIISKERNASGIWSVFHKSTGDGRLQLQSNAAVTTGVWTTLPNSTTFWQGSSYADGNQRVAYCFAEVAGYSKFGSYTGNGSSDGPFIYTGFRPKFVMFKRTDSAGDWNIRDTSRSPYNTVGEALYPNLSYAEYSGSETYIDVLSNGFKLRGNWASDNASGANYIYAAFAENPMKYALAR